LPKNSITPRLIEGGDEPIIGIDTENLNLGDNRLTARKGVNYIKMGLQNQVGSGWKYLET
jgi:hypothetical protein